jgi:hypothetical protein
MNKKATKTPAENVAAQITPNTKPCLKAAFHNSCKSFLMMFVFKAQLLHCAD